MNKKKMYKFWLEMKKRCENPDHRYFEYYGGVGIGYEDSWKDFEVFYSDMKVEYPTSVVFKRLDSSQHYSKENCYWIDVLNPDINVENYQAETKKTETKKLDKYYSFNGRIKDTRGFADEYNINYFTLKKRLERGWSIERALTEDVREQKTRRKTAKK